MIKRAEISASGFQLEADVVAAALRVGPDEIMAHIRDGSLTTRCEKGVDKDLGRHRLTFSSEAGRQGSSSTTAERSFKVPAST